MTKTLLSSELTFADMVKIVKTGKSYLPICRMLNQHLLDVVEVALCKLQLLIDDNKKIEKILEGAEATQKLPELHQLCNRSTELYAEIENLPLMKENPDNLVELLILSKIGSRYSELLSLLYTERDYIKANQYPYANMDHVHVK